MKPNLNVTLYDAKGIPLLVTQSRSTEEAIDDANNMYPTWKTIIVMSPYGGVKAGAPGVAEKLVKIVYRTTATAKPVTIR